MKAARVRELTHDELVRKQQEVTKELFDARLEAATGQLGHTHKVKMLRRQVARLQTIVRERELADRDRFPGERRLGFLRPVSTRSTRRTVMPRLIRTGTVVASGAEKTITVLVERLVEHRLYKRRYRKSTRFAVHDEKNEGRIGDRVQIEECRPLSRTKRFRLLKVVERAT